MLVRSYVDFFFLLESAVTNLHVATLDEDLKTIASVSGLMASIDYGTLNSPCEQGTHRLFSRLSLRENVNYN